MSEEDRRQYMPGAPPVQLTGDMVDFMAPMNAPKAIKDLNYWTHSPAAAAGKYRKAHELLYTGDAWLRSWAARIHTDDLKQKEMALEQVNAVVGQVSRGMGGYLAALLTTERMEITEKQSEKKGGSIWSKLFGRVKV
ncbi:MAG TPA: hypothetical protein PKX17_03465 [Candidatus Methanomethylicus sp.]|nr:hypothetical protein [Candidatus Methanomethylicus sp.]